MRQYLIICNDIESDERWVLTTRGGWMKVGADDATWMRFATIAAARKFIETDSRAALPDWGTRQRIGHRDFGKQAAA